MNVFEFRNLIASEDRKEKRKSLQRSLIKSVETGANGTQDYVVKNVPVVVTQFAVELSQDVDYIHVKGVGPGGSHVPTRSNIQCTVQPIYSRRAVENFSLQKFVNGNYVKGSGGFI